jgi:predicted RNase H-like nuclease
VTARVVGVDLAWGYRSRTGLCAVDGAGRVTASASVLSDEEIVAWMMEHAPDPEVVGFDAPIVVTNPKGRRRCEDLVSRAFGAQRAGAHSANLGMSCFSLGSRAAALAARLGLGVAPDDPGGAGLAVEVYPHSALVALFHLPVRLAYKSGRGRTVGDRRPEMARLVVLIAALAGRDPALDARATPRFGLLAGAVGEATRHVELDRIEDELDAYVCAYVALCLAADRRDGGGRVRVLGEWADGAIVTPVDERHALVLDALP